jgi:hypothetical protein
VGEKKEEKHLNGKGTMKLTIMSDLKKMTSFLNVSLNEKTEKQANLEAS